MDVILEGEEWQGESCWSNGRVEACDKEACLGGISTGAASGRMEQVDKNGSGRKRQFQALLLCFLRWQAKDLSLETYRVWVDGEKKDDHLCWSHAEDANHWPRGQAKVRLCVLYSTRGL